MKTMTISDAAAASCGQLCGSYSENTRLGEVIIDSRLVKPGDLFVAFKGEHADGHDFVAAAFERGAACCLVSRVPPGESRPLILVPDIQDALESICAVYRKKLNIPIVGITGSVGKTTAKEMIAAVLETKLAVLKTAGNLNNQIGVPMTVSRIEAEHEAAVVEMGISDFGEMSRLAQIARPTIAVFTVIGHAHLEFLRDADGVLKAKSEMLDYMPESALVIINGDDKRLAAMHCRQRRLSVGLGEDCDIRAVDIVLRDGCTCCSILAPGRRINARIPAYGLHMVYAALEGAAVGIELGLSDAEIERGIAQYQTVGRRAAITHTDFLTLIDDSYNANPDSMRCGIESLAGMPGRKVCILGDMLELGEGSAAMHREIGGFATERGAALVLSCGEFAAELCAGAGGIARCFPSREALIEALPGLIQKGDCVLVKASRSSRFEEIAEALKELN